MDAMSAARQAITVTAGAETARPSPSAPAETGRPSPIAEKGRPSHSIAEKAPLRVHAAGGAGTPGATAARSLHFSEAEVGHRPPLTEGEVELVLESPLAGSDMLVVEDEEASMF